MTYVDTSLLRKPAWRRHSTPTASGSAGQLVHRPTQYYSRCRSTAYLHTTVSHVATITSLIFLHVLRPKFSLYLYFVCTLSAHAAFWHNKQQAQQSLRDCATRRVS